MNDGNVYKNKGLPAQPNAAKNTRVPGSGFSGDEIAGLISSGKFKQVGDKITFDGNIVRIANKSTTDRNFEVYPSGRTDRTFTQTTLGEETSSLWTFIAIDSANSTGYNSEDTYYQYEM